jgi:hypothetical protein
VQKSTRISHPACRGILLLYIVLHDMSVMMARFSGVARARSYSTNRPSTDRVAVGSEIRTRCGPAPEDPRASGESERAETGSVASRDLLANVPGTI